MEFEDALGQKFAISVVDPDVAKRIADRLLLLKNGLRATTLLSYSRGQLRSILQDIESDRFQNTLDKSTHQVTLSFPLATPSSSCGDPSRATPPEQ